MEVITTSSNRDIILKVIREKTGVQPVCSYSPDFTYTAGEYSFRRDGVISCENDAAGVLSELAELGLIDSGPPGSCSGSESSDQSHDREAAQRSQGGMDQSYYPDREAAQLSQGDMDQSIQGRLVRRLPKGAERFCYQMERHTGRTLLNLVGIISARQVLIDQALGAKCFSVDHETVAELYRHPPVTRDEFLQKIFGSESMLAGLTFSREWIVLDGFLKARSTNPEICGQLSDAIMETALKSAWIKPFTRNVRNRKYAMRTWLNQIGMTGPEYEESRRVLLERLYGKADRHKL